MAGTSIVVLGGLKSGRMRAVLLDLVVLLTSAGIGAALSAGVLKWQRLPSRGLPYSDQFATGSYSEWTAYDGNWNAHSGVMINESNERGAKLITGSSYWTDYALDADILLNSMVDAGVIARVADAEPGVDSYSGIYGGVRMRDEALLLGVADHGWNEPTAKSMPEPISANVWYDIRMEPRDCHITLSARREGQTSATQISTSIPECPARGKIGLRSYDSGGQWKNVSVTQLPQ